MPEQTVPVWVAVVAALGGMAITVAGWWTTHFLQRWERRNNRLIDVYSALIGEILAVDEQFRTLRDAAIAVRSATAPGRFGSAEFVRLMESYTAFVRTSGTRYLTVLARVQMLETDPVLLKMLENLRGRYNVRFNLSREGGFDETITRQVDQFGQELEDLIAAVRRRHVKTPFDVEP